MIASLEKNAHTDVDEDDDGDVDYHHLTHGVVVFIDYDDDVVDVASTISTLSS